MATATNTAVVQFPTPTGSWGTVTHYGIWSLATGGVFLGGGQLSAQRTPGSGSDVEFAAEELDFVVGNGDFTNAAGQDAIRGALSGNGARTNFHISLHSGDPGDDGSNEISGNAYARVALALTGLTYGPAS